MARASGRSSADSDSRLISEVSTKNPWVSSHSPPRSTPPAIDLSNLTPTLRGLSSNVITTSIKCQNELKRI